MAPNNGAGVMSTTTKIGAPPALQQAVRNSTSTWQSDLQSLFEQAKSRFPDVVWELVGDDSRTEEVWGHKAIVYCRAPPSFQARYYNFRPAPVSSPYMDATQSAFSLDIPGISRSPSPFRTASPSPSMSTAGGLMRLTTAINPALFSNELEYLYTGKGFGEAFEFLFDTSESRAEGDAEDARIDKLRTDLVFMWRSRLYSDVKIALTGNFRSSTSSVDVDDTTAIFTSHRFILVSRSEYFHNALSPSWGNGVKSTPGEILTVTLPSPPFTPASLHFTLGFIYTGTLHFSHRTYDLTTAFHIMRSATYLALDSLYDEIQARIVQEMAHGLYHAFLPFEEYDALTAGKWGPGGCRCRQCAKRAPRILEFSLGDDVKNPILERGARRALVGLYGEGWCTTEFAALPQKIKDGLVRGLKKRSTPNNVFGLLFAAHHGLTKLSNVVDAWADGVRDCILRGRAGIDATLCEQVELCFEEPEWVELVEADGVGFDDAQRVEWVMESVRRGITEKNAGIVYQTMVSSILIRPHATNRDSTMLSNTSAIRVRVEEARVDILKWMRKRWVGVREEGGFDNLEGWSLKEISDEIEVPVQELIGSSVSSPQTNKNGVEINDADSASIDNVSVRPSVINRNRSVTPSSGAPRTPVGNTLRVPSSSASSVRSVARSTMSTTSRTSTVSRTTLSRPILSKPTPSPTARKHPPPGPRPDSKLTPSSSASSVRSSLAESARSTLSKPSTPLGRPKSLAPSITTSIRSHASTVRKPSPGAGPSTLRSPISRPGSSVSTRSDNSSAFKTAHSDLVRSRQNSVTSTKSTAASVKTTGPKPPVPRSRTASVASSRTTSVASTLSTAKKRPGVPAIDPAKLSPAMAKRSASELSTRSSVVSTATATSRKSVVKKPTTPGAPPKSDASSVKGKSRASTLVSEDKAGSTISSRSTSTVKGGSTIRRKGSSDTITKFLEAPLAASISPRGATLDIGIPCIISSKRKRFRAFARYIGEVEGETGPWVGVEVPVGSENWANGEQFAEGRNWHDGTWGGVRYFDIGLSGVDGSERDYGEESRASRRRRVDLSVSLKREGDQLSVDRAKRMRSVSPAVSDVSNSSESRGLFVRPQQVLYVVDAVGADL